MKYLLLTIIMGLHLSTSAQTNSAFRMQLAHHLSGMDEGQTLHLNYQKKGCWGVFEQGQLTFTLDNNDRVLVEQKTLQDGKSVTQTSTGYDRSELIAKLENAKDIARADDEYAINNVVIYTFKKDDRDLGVVSLPLLPEEIINPIAMDVNLSDFFKKDGKKGGLIKF